MSYIQIYVLSHAGCIELFLLSVSGKILYIKFTYCISLSWSSSTTEIKTDIWGSSQRCWIWFSVPSTSAPFMHLCKIPALGYRSKYGCKCSVHRHRLCTDTKKWQPLLMTKITPDKSTWPLLRQTFRTLGGLEILIKIWIQHDWVCS